MSRETRIILEKYKIKPPCPAESVDFRNLDSYNIIPIYRWFYGIYGCSFQCSSDADFYCSRIYYLQNEKSHGGSSLYDVRRACLYLRALYDRQLFFAVRFHLGRFRADGALLRGDARLANSVHADPLSHLPQKIRRQQVSHSDDRFRSRQRRILRASDRESLAPE